ncbi:MAG TPA: hypothetical protein VMY42_23530 [Thermoguttaceae bacterium]|nr:hypothetical protein [Thermoguttaceae bacterium]
MRILINHLTRMRAGKICIAGVDVETRRHVRPVLGYEGLTAKLLARYGGPFDMARIVELGNPRPKPNRPHTEDHEFAPSRVRFRRNASAAEFWEMLRELGQSSLQEIFGGLLRDIGQSRWAADVGQGAASLGVLRPHGPPQLYLRTDRDRKPQIRIKLGDGRLEADAGVTDLRLYGPDHATPDADMVRAAARWIANSEGVLLGVGLTRKFRPSDGSGYLHYLQVNNVHLEEDPAWRLG